MRKFVDFSFIETSCYCCFKPSSAKFIFIKKSSQKTTFSQVTLSKEVEHCYFKNLIKPENRMINQTLLNKTIFDSINNLSNSIIRNTNRDKILRILDINPATILNSEKNQIPDYIFQISNPSLSQFCKNTLISPISFSQYHPNPLISPPPPYFPTFNFPSLNNITPFPRPLDIYCFPCTSS